MYAEKKFKENVSLKSQYFSYGENQQNERPAISKPLLRNVGTDYTYKHKGIVWQNVFFFIVLHVVGVSGFIMIFSGYIKLNTCLWAVFFGYFTSQSITIGAHRYYTHRSFKTSQLVRAVFVLLQTAVGQNSMFTWVRDHRLHHQYADTDADPHNSKRGFFFSHIGWLMVKKHPCVIELGRKIDMSDLQADWMVMFQKKYFIPLYFIFGILLPVWVPVHFFGETWWNSLWCVYFTRYMLVLNVSWLVNSAAHLYGTRPYDKSLQPVESWFVSLLTLGEGWHNYHHAFPWDYRAAEFTFLNATAKIIKFMDTIGLVYDLKIASPDTITKRIMRTGDGTHDELGSEEGKSAVTACGPLHPLNPSYTSTLSPSDTVYKPEGLPLFHETDVFNAKYDYDQLQRNLGSIYYHS